MSPPAADEASPQMRPRSRTATVRPLATGGQGHGAADDAAAHDGDIRAL